MAPKRGSRPAAPALAAAPAPAPAPAASGPAPDDTAGATRSVGARCSKCDNQIGEFLNEWIRITNSYYLPALPASYSVFGLARAGGGAKDASTDTDLSGCRIQPLSCSKCSENLAFHCVHAPAKKAAFLNREFFKLSKITLVSEATGEPVMPALDDLRAEYRPENLHPSVEPAGDDTTDADYDAIREKNTGVPWPELHQRWASRTGQRLSPSSFGKHLLAAEARYTRPTSTSQSHSSPIPPSRLNGGRTPSLSAHPSPQPGFVPPNTSHPAEPLRQSSDSLHRQRMDINRIDMALSSLVNDVRSLQTAVTALQHDRPSAVGNPSGLDMLSETISSMSAKAGEVDGLKAQIELMRVRLRRLEGGPSYSSSAQQEPLPTLPPPSQLAGRMSIHSDPSQASLPPLHGHAAGVAIRGSTQPMETEAPASGWVSVNQKRRSPIGDIIDTSKRRRLSAEGIPRPNIGAVSSQGSAVQPIRPAEYHPYAVHNQPPSDVSGKFVPNTQQDDSQESWRPFEERSARGGHSGRGRPGRPRKSSPADQGTPAWEREGFDAASHVGPDGYYKPISGPTGTTRTRGQVIRRTSSGSGTGGFQVHDQQLRDKDKKTRLKPVRNEEGILIRKDGRPDKRSISSPENLKKVHARKLQLENQKIRSSPLPANVTHGESDTLDDKEDDPSTPVRRPDASVEPDAETTPIIPDSQDTHAGIMKQVFPGGVEAQTTRMNPAAPLLQSESAEGQATVQSRQDSEVLVSSSSPASTDPARTAPSDPVLGANDPSDIPAPATKVEEIEKNKPLSEPAATASTAIESNIPVSSDSTLDADSATLAHQTQLST